MHPIFANSTSYQITKLDSLHITLSPGEGFTAIANILSELHAHECTSPKKRVDFQEMTSEIMGIIYWTYLIWSIYKETSNIQFLTSTCSFTYTKMIIGNMKISHQMVFSTLNIKFRITLELKLNGTLEVCDFWMDFGDENNAQ
eukprot:145312_1